MNRTTRTSIALSVVGLAAAGTGACAASSTAPTPGSGSADAAHSESTSPGMTTVGGMTSCTKAELAEAATAAAQAMGADNVYTIDDLLCADGWAVTAGVLANTDDPDMGAPTSFVFEQEGRFWVLQDKAQVCGTKPTTTTAPADAAIPGALFVAGCAAG